MKIKLLFLIFILFYLAIIVRLFYLQVLRPRVSNNQPYLKTEKIVPERGKIYDRNKNPLVLNENSYLLYLEPKKIDKKSKLIEKLSKSLEIKEASLEANIDDSKYYQAIQGGLNEEKKKEIESFQLKGIGFDYQMQRFYPEASIAAHLLGFVGKNETGDNLGYFGLEGFYDKDLKGLPGFIESEKDILGRPIFIGTQEKVNAEDGRDLVLTIDKTVQESSKNVLKQGLEKYQAKQGCIITADPSTMQILGLVCLPDYDQANYFKFSEDFFKDPAISDLYEPGSIFKPLMMAAAIEEKKIKPTDSYNEDGPIKIGDYSIKTWNDKYEGKISITRILEKSSNTGMVFVGEKLGQGNIFKYLQKYGFDEKTEIDLQGEMVGYLKPKSQWYPIDFATITFGQGIAVTPIQMLRAFTSLINGGKLLKPYLVQKITSSDRENIIKPKVERQVVSKTTSEIIKKMLVSAVENGEYHWDRPKGYQIGGKTGTAQVPIAGHYDPTKTIASFIGFFPVDNPKIITLVILKEPKASPWGSETAAPMFFELAKQLIVYYGMTPEQ